MRSRILTPFFQSLDNKIASLGGVMNAHLHLDRAGTYDDTMRLLADRGVLDGTTLTLAGKHAVIPLVHASALYDPDALGRRVARYLDDMVEVGTRRADTVVDVTIDRVGRTALDVLCRLRGSYAGRIDFRVGAYSPLGFRDDEPERWGLIESAAEQADFLGLLPERDDKATYPDHIGYEESCRRGLVLAARQGKDIHIHVDQANHSHDAGGELVARLVRELDLGRSRDAEPFVWLIHLISPSSYDDQRFDRLAANLAELGIGVICCPSGAISMRQLRPLASPTSNSIARVLELLDAGVQVRLGSDNICDITMPMGTPDLMDEVFVLANAVRFYDQDILARIATGLPLQADDRARLRAHLRQDQTTVAEIISKLPGAGNEVSHTRAASVSAMAK
jgi:cytosine deaminase